MSVHRRVDGRGGWTVRWREGSVNRARAFRTRREAQAFDAQQRERARWGAHAPAEPARVELEEWLRDWWRTEGVRWSQNTKERRASVLDRWIVPHLGAASLRDLGTARVLDWRAEILKGGCPPTQANHALSILSAALGVAVGRGMLPANPCRPVRRLPVRVVRPRALTAEEVERIRAEMPTARDRAMVSLGAYAGLRPQEVLALSWDAVRERVLWIDSADDGHGQVKDTKTRLARSVPIVPSLAEDLDRLRLKAPSDEALVVTGARLGPLDLKNWRSRVWHPALERAGVKRAVPYDLRHTFASLMIYGGASVVEVAAAMGHARPTLTLERYAHLFADADGAPRVPLAEAATAARNALARADVLSLFSEDPPALHRRAAAG